MSLRGGRKRVVSLTRALLGILDRSPSELVACHRCDTPSCVNPGHLFAATQKENMQDALRKGRLMHQKITHCPMGHVYNERNVLHLATGYRRCLECNRVRNRAWRRKVRPVKAHELLAIMERTKHGVWHDAGSGKWVSVAGRNFNTAAEAIAAIPARRALPGLKETG
jgi:ferredoxin-like protein FixX